MDGSLAYKTESIGNGNSSINNTDRTLLVLFVPHYALLV
jgi:hypothetical protein